MMLISLVLSHGPSLYEFMQPLQIVASDAGLYHQITNSKSSVLRLNTNNSFMKFLIRFGGGKKNLWSY